MIQDNPEYPFLVHSEGGQKCATSCLQVCGCYADFFPAVSQSQVQTQDDLIALNFPNFQHLASFTKQLKFVISKEYCAAIRTIVRLEIDAWRVRFWYKSEIKS